MPDMTPAILRGAMRQHDGNLTRAAVALEVPRTTLRAQLARAGLLGLITAPAGRPASPCRTYVVEVEGRHVAITVGPSDGLSARWAAGR